MTDTINKVLKPGKENKALGESPAKRNQTLQAVVASQLSKIEDLEKVNDGLNRLVQELLEKIGEMKKKMTRLEQELVRQREERGDSDSNSPILMKK